MAQPHRGDRRGLDAALGDHIGILVAAEARAPVLEHPQAAGADLVFIGGTEAGFIEQLLGYAIPLELADRTTVPVITVYEMPAEPKRWLS